MPQAVFRVSRSLLARLLNLPPGMEITGVHGCEFFVSGAAVVRVSHPGLPDSPEGEPYRTLNPVCHADGTVTFPELADYTPEEQP